MLTRDSDPLRFSAHTQAAGFVRYHRMAERAELLCQAAKQAPVAVRERSPLLTVAWLAGIAVAIAAVLVLTGTVSL